MTVRRHDYSSRADLRVMQQLTQRIWSPSARWHIGDVAWERSSTMAAAHQWRTALWTDGALCRAWGWVELPGELNLVVDPAAAELVADVLTWVHQVAPHATHRCTVLETEAHLVEGLSASGFRPLSDGPYFRHHVMPMADLPQPSLPPGYRLRHVEPGGAAERAAVHRAGWSDFGSRLSTHDYARVMSTWPYRADLDWVVQSPEGELVASALGWLDEANAAGLLEPVGCAPAYRRMGLAAAVSIAVLGALRRAGAATAHVNPRGDDSYPAPGVLYRRIGFLPGPRTLTFTRDPQGRGAPHASPGS